MRIDQEIWKPVPYFTGYEVSNYGQVRSYKKPGGRGILIQEPRLIKSFKDKLGRSKIMLWKNGKVYRFWIPRLMMLSFIGPCPENNVTCHEDNNYSNNYLKNFRYDTQQGNLNDRKKFGTMPIGERHGRSKLTDIKVNIIRSLYRSPGNSQRKLAKQFNVSQFTINAIVNNKSWTHLLKGEVNANL
jgi:hypothetical protein